MANLYSPKHLKYGIAVQAAWGTATAYTANLSPATGSTSIGGELSTDHIDLDFGHDVFEEDYAHGVMVKVEDDTTIRSDGGMPKFKLKGRAKHDILDQLLYSIFHNVTEVVGTPYGKTFIFDKTSAQVDFTNDEGYFNTFIMYDPVTDKSLSIKDVICERLLLSAEPGGHLMYEASMVGRGVPTEITTPTGTWTIAGQNFWHYEDIANVSFNIGGAFTPSLIGPISLEISYPQLSKTGIDGGDFEQFYLGVPQITLTCGMAHVDAGYHSTVLGARNTTGLFRIGWGNATPGAADGDLDFSCYGKVIEHKKLTAAGQPLGDQLTIRVAATSANNPVTIVMANAQDRGW